MNKYDAIIVGAGFSGITVAERLINSHQFNTVLILEKRSHIGGNCYDYYNEAGVLVHKYGPHYFRTNNESTKKYLSKFTDWSEYKYEVKSYTHGKYWHFPINLNTFEQLIGKASTEDEMISYLNNARVKIDKITNSEEAVISQVGWELYEKFFKNYTIKQWNKDPRDLDPSVCQRIPIRTNRDNSYLKEKFQAMPANGYTNLFNNMVKACKGKLEIRYNVDYKKVLPFLLFDHLIYTGPIDYFYDDAFGPLPYRSLKFDFKSFSKNELESRFIASNKPGFWQPYLQVNYPNEEKFTRIVEIKHATGQKINNTTISVEYPISHTSETDPYYPIPNYESDKKYQQYKTLANNNVYPKSFNPILPNHPKLWFVGRLAEYTYINMDQTVTKALALSETIRDSYKSVDTKYS